MTKRATGRRAHWGDGKHIDWFKMGKLADAGLYRRGRVFWPEELPPCRSGEGCSACSCQLWQAGNTRGGCGYAASPRRLRLHAWVSCVRIAGTAASDE